VDDRFARWLAALERRLFAELTFPEVRRALRALSSAYVQRRERLRDGAPLDARGKRAAYALFYAPLHFLVVSRILEELHHRAGEEPSTVLDLGCGTGAAGAAWALHLGGRTRVIGIDNRSWALGEARHTWKELSVVGRTQQRDAATGRWPRPCAQIVAAYLLNELNEDAQDRLLARMIRAANEGAAILVVEPISRRIAPRWKEWTRPFVEAGGRADEWRFPVELPELLSRLDRAAGLDHDVLTARSLWLARSEP
jgi:SAM-dependent methyltransferase